MIRTIVLTDRAPVKIDTEVWVRIAQHQECNDSPQRPCGVESHYEHSCWAIAVRQHTDGRTIVYGSVTGEPCWTLRETWEGGVIVPADGDVAAAIRSVAEAGKMPERIARNCIADLPAVTLP